MQASSTRDVRVAGGGGQVAAHSGLFALGRFADGLGLGEALSAAVPNAGERAPDSPWVLRRLQGLEQAWDSWTQKRTESGWYVDPGPYTIWTARSSADLVHAAEIQFGGVIS